MEYKGLDFSCRDNYNHTSVKLVNINGRYMPIHEFDSLNELSMFAGYLKYAYRTSGNVFYRGQSNLYINNLNHLSLRPSLFREITHNSEGDLEKCNQMIYNTLENNTTLKRLKDFDITPLLQHYGIKTEWLDVVDNLWVAIWFAIHSTKRLLVNSKIDDKTVTSEYIELANRISSEDAYILFVLADGTKEKVKKPGFFYGENTQVVDLRKAFPSIYLRPHAQHALVIKKNGNGDYNGLVVGIAKIKVQSGFEWVGSQGLLSPNNLFPSVFYDHGYKYLLENFIYKEQYGDLVNHLGCIQHITTL